MRTDARRAALLLTLLGVARAETVTVINPTADGDGSVSVAAGLAAAAEAALARHPRLRRAGEQALRADEVAAVFGCLEFDPACARRAGQAAEADLVLYGEVRRIGQRFDVELVLMRVADGSADRSGHRVIRQRGDPVELQGGVELALRQLARQVLYRTDPLSAAVVLPGPVAAQTAEGAPVPARRLTPIAPGLHTLRFETGGEARIQLERDEALVLAPPRAAREEGLTPVGMTAFISAGGAAVAFASAAYLGSLVEQEQSDYNNSQDPDRLKHHAETGIGHADAANALLIAGGVAATISLVLFLIDD